MTVVWFMDNELFLVPGDVAPTNRDDVKALVWRGQAVMFAGISKGREAVVGYRPDLVWFDEPSMNGWVWFNHLLDKLAPSGVVLVTTSDPARAAAASIHGFEVLRI
jgi:hypothetical protein